MESLHALFLERGVEGFLDSSEEGAGFEIMFAFHVFAVDAQSKIFGHFALFNSSDARSFKSMSELLKTVIAIEFATMSKATSPSKNGSNRVGARFLALLPSTPMASDCAVSSFSFHGFAVGHDKDRSHETQRAVALGDNVGLDITVVVFAGPDEATLRFEGLGDHVIDETMFIPEAFGFVLLFVLFFVDFLENIFETAIVFFEDGVFGGHVEREATFEGKLERRMSKAFDGSIRVVHA
jgi:hypothetical protein